MWSLPTDVHLTVWVIVHLLWVHYHLVRSLHSSHKHIAIQIGYWDCVCVCVHGMCVCGVWVCMCVCVHACVVCACMCGVCMRVWCVHVCACACGIRVRMPKVLKYGIHKDAKETDKTITLNLYLHIWTAVYIKREGRGHIWIYQHSFPEAYTPAHWNMNE